MGGGCKFIKTIKTKNDMFTSTSNTAFSPFMDISVTVNTTPNWVQSSTLDVKK